MTQDCNTICIQLRAVQIHSHSFYLSKQRTHTQHTEETRKNDSGCPDASPSSSRVFIVFRRVASHSLNSGDTRGKGREQRRPVDVYTTEEIPFEIPLNDETGVAAAPRSINILGLISRQSARNQNLKIHEIYYEFVTKR